MLLEQLIFIIISFMLFVLMFVKMIRNNDTNYVIILILEAVGILINLIEVLMSVKLATVFKILKYVFAILLPVLILALEKQNSRFFEVINIAKAQLYMSLGNDKKAKNILINIVTKYQDSYKGHKMLAEIYEKEGGMRKAIDEYVQAIDIDKQDYDSYYKVAKLLTQFDKKDEATEMLNNLLQKKPEYYKATELLGDLLIEKEMYKEAVNVYMEALKYNPMSYELNYSLGIAFTMLNDFQSAKMYYEKAAELNSLAYHSKYSLAEIALIYKELEEAEKRFLEVLEEEGELEADAYYELAKINMIKGEKEKAINYANIAIEIDAKKIAPKIKNDEIFIPILAKITIPFNLENMEEVKVKKLNHKELMAKEHLEQMVDITRDLSYYDIHLLKKNGKEIEEKDQNSIDGRQKEIE